MKIQVVYGRTTAAEALKCPRCGGTGRAETYFGSGKFETCPYCEGAGHALKGASAYTYDAAEAVAINDIVEVPGNWLVPGPQEATVVALGSGYDGTVSSVRRVIERASPRAG